MPADLWANYRLGLIYIEKANAGAQAAGSAALSTQEVMSLLSEAKVRFGNVVAANPDTDEANRARQYIAKIDAALASPR
jgi:hypothetical protein